MFCGLISFSQNINNCGDTIISPNAFTPTKLTNSEFYPFVYGYDDYKLTIYDRWGGVIYEGKSWDGTKNGKLCEQGVYVWKLVAFNIDCQTMLQGYVILIE